jgi:peptide/nickel transport system substrate-binding protein
VISLLRALGYRTSTKTLDGEKYFSYVTDPSRHFQVTLSAWGADYPAASNFIAGIASCDPDLALFNVSQLCEKDTQAGIAAAVKQQVADPGGASDAWAALDRKVVDDAAVIPFFGGLQQDFVSRRVGNVLVNPELGPLIDQMWVL